MLSLGNLEELICLFALAQPALSKVFRTKVILELVRFFFLCSLKALNVQLKMAR